MKKSCLAGGMTDNIGTLTSAAEIYDPEAAAGNGPWSQAESLVSARYAHGAAVLPNGDVLVAGGSDRTGEPRIRRNLDSRLVSAELYEVRYGRWKPAGLIAEGRGAGHINRRNRHIMYLRLSPSRHSSTGETRLDTGLM